MKLLVAFAALLALSACASTGAGRVDWTCDGGRAYSVRASASSAAVFAAGRTYELPAAGGGYNDGAVSYDPVSGALTGAFAGPYENCRRG